MFLCKKEPILKTLPTNVLYEHTECDLFHPKNVNSFLISQYYIGDSRYNDFSMSINDEMNMYCILRSHVPAYSDAIIDLGELNAGYIISPMRKVAELKNIELSILGCQEKDDEKLFYKKLKEHQRKGFNLIQDDLQGFKHYLESLVLPGNNGLIFIIANPFTLGHQYLIEYAASHVSNLYIATSNKDLNFTAHDRWEMLKLGTSHLSNVHLIEMQDFIGSEILLWPFLYKALANPKYIDFEFQNIVTLDIYCKTLGISTRFFGEEPVDEIAKTYMEEFISKAKKYNVEAKVIKRKTEGNQVISGTFIRDLFENNPDEIKKYVPARVFEYLMSIRNK